MSELRKLNATIERMDQRIKEYQEEEAKQVVEMLRGMQHADNMLEYPA